MDTTIVAAATALLGVVIGALSTGFIAWLQHKMELKRFYSQSWWEKKESAYSHIIERLSHLQYHYGKWLESLELGTDFDDEFSKQLGESYRQAREDIEKAAAAGAYIISDDAAGALEDYLHADYRLGGSPNWYEELDAKYGLVKECMAKVRECARTDLKGGAKQP